MTTTVSLSLARHAATAPFGEGSITVCRRNSTSQPRIFLGQDVEKQANRDELCRMSNLAVPAEG